MMTSEIQRDGLQNDIIELQTRVQFQEDALQKLDGELVAHQQMIDQLLRKIVELEERLEQLKYEQSISGRTPSEEPPPHY